VITFKIEGNHRYNWIKNKRLSFVSLHATSHLRPQHGQLTPERGILRLKSTLRPERRGEQRQEEAYQREHRRRR